MLNIASFITPLAVRPDPNGAIQNAGQGLGHLQQSNEEKARLGEQTRHSQVEEGLQQGHLDLSKQEHADTLKEHKRDLHIKMLDWATGVLDKEGYEKGLAIVGPVLRAAGIGWEQPAAGTPDQGPQPQAGPAPSTPSAPQGPDTGANSGNAGIDKANADAAAIRGTSVSYPGQPAATARGNFTDSRDPLAAQAAQSTVRSDRSTGLSGDEISPEQASRMFGTPISPGDTGIEANDALKKRLGAGETGDEGINMPPPNLSKLQPKPGESLSEFVGKKGTKPTKNEVEAGPVATNKAEAKAESVGATPPIRLYDAETGETYGYLDAGKIEAENQRRAKSREAAYEKGLGGTTPQEIGAGFMGGARNESDLETRYGHAEHYITQNEKTKRAALVGKGGGNGLNPKLTATLTDDQEAHVKAALTSAGVPKLQQAGNDGEKVASLAESKDPLQDKVAAGQMLKSLFGAAASEGERAFVFGSEGEFVRLQQMANNWLNGGQMPPQFAAAIRHAAARMGELARRKAHDITVRVVGNVASDPAIGFERMGLKTPQEKEARRKTLEDLGSAGEGTSANDEASKLGF